MTRATASASWTGRKEALNLCRQIRSDEATAELPVLVLSKSQRGQDKIACLEAGATEYLMKPYQRAELLSRVSSHLRSWNTERERTARFAQLNLVHSVSTVLASSLEPEVLLKGTLSILNNYMHAESALAYHGSNQSMSVVASEGFPVTEEVRSSLLDFYFMTAPLMNGNPLLVEPLPEACASRSRSPGLERRVAASSVRRLDFMAIP